LPLFTMCARYHASKGIGAKKNARQAAYWYEKSARQGHPDAAHRLALMHLTDEGIKRDVEKGAEWLEKRLNRSC